MADTDKVPKPQDAGAFVKQIVSNPVLVILFTLMGGFGGQSLFGVSKEALEAKFTVMQSKQDRCWRTRRTPRRKSRTSNAASRALKQRRSSA